MNDKIITVQGQLFFSYNLDHLNGPKPWNEKNPDSWRYELHLGQLDDTTVKRLEKELNVKARKKDDDSHGLGMFIKCKSKFPFTVADLDGNPIDPSDVGNGTVAVVALKSYDHPMSKQYGWSARCVGGKTKANAVVKDLVKREKEETAEDVAL